MVGLYLYWAYFKNNKSEGYADKASPPKFAIKDGLWPNLRALAKVGITVTETVSSGKDDAFATAATDPSAVGVKVDATGPTGVVYKVVRASDVSGGHFRNYTQFYTPVGSQVGGIYVKLP